MSKRDKSRKDRRKEESRRHARWERDLLATKSLLTDNVDASAIAFTKECTDAVSQHRTLRRIIELPYQPGDEASDATLISRYGLDGNHHYEFTVPDGQGDADATGYGTSGGNLGGYTLFFRDPDGQDFSIIFLRKPPELDSESAAKINMGVLFHELGHVDDFERGLNMVPGRPLNIGEAEYYANAYACRMLYEKRYYIPLSVWFAGIERSIASCGVPAVEAAARRLMNDDFYKRPRHLLRHMVRLFEPHLYGAEVSPISPPP